MLPLVVLIPTATHWYPRYLLFLAVPSLILAARALTVLSSWLADRVGLTFRHGRFVLVATAAGLALVPSLRLDPFLWVEPSRAPAPCASTPFPLPGSMARGPRP